MESNFRNLAPDLCRQRIVIEATTDHLITENEIKEYMVKLSEVVDMKLLSEPFAYPAEKDGELVGYGGWIHWVTSGCHVYSYSAEFTKIGLPLITVDCYTCKPFSIDKAVAFTKNYFKTKEIVWKNS